MAELGGTADLLRALASPSRLAILKILRRPCRLSDIQVMQRETPLSRQAVRRHLDVLIEQGLVRCVPEAEGHYVLDHEGLFVAVDRVTRLIPLQTVAEPGTAADNVSP